MNPPKMPVHIGDYKRDTGHLRAAGHGAYTLLMYHYWSTGGLPNDDEQLAAIACMTRGEWRKHKPIIQAFFKEGWKHGRIEKDLEAAKQAYQARAKAGEKGGKAKAENKQKPSNATAGPEQPFTFNLEPEREDTADAVPSSPTPYAFESGIVRLTEEGFKKWETAFPRLDLRAELTGLSEWANQQGERWFFALSGALAKRNRNIKSSSEKHRVAPSDRDWKEAII